MAILRVYLVFAVISITFPGLSNFFISVLALTTIIFTLTFLLYSKVLYLSSLR